MVNTPRGVWSSMFPIWEFVRRLSFLAASIVLGGQVTFSRKIASEPLSGVPGGSGSATREMREDLLNGKIHGSANKHERLRRAAYDCGAMLLLLLSLPGVAAWASAAQEDRTLLPEAPEPQNTTQTQTAKTVPDPCRARNAGHRLGVQAAEAIASAEGLPAPVAERHPEVNTEEVPCASYTSLMHELPIIKKINMPLINWYARFLDGPQVKPMTPKEKGWLAVRNVGDPFNGITILGSSAIAVGSDAHSAYGPGFHGFERYVGVSVTEDMTGEFFGTFLIPSVMHQDPHYHRMPTASMKKRIAHAFYQVVWTQGDNGKGMLNYADLAGFAIDDEIGNLYIPGRETDLPASAERYGTTMATAPIDNFVTEFLPDVARKIHVRVVLIQQIINQVANVKDNGGS